MEIIFGKYKGKTTQSVLLKAPDYVRWVMSQEDARGDLLSLQINFQHLIEIFDEKPFQWKCSSCKGQATRIVFYQGDSQSGCCYCDKCNPYAFGDDLGCLTSVSKYVDAIKFIGYFCWGRKYEYQNVIQNLVFAKGFKGKMTKQNLQTFFKPTN